MMVKALKKKNNMSGPFKLKSGNSPLFKNVGSSPARDRDKTVQESGGPPKSGDGRPKTGKTFQQAWDGMNDTQRSKHGSFTNFKTAAQKYNEENA
mgnify:FL=1|jgi:hypothetical protein